MPSLKAAVLALALAPAQAAKTAEENDSMWVHNNRDGLGCEWVSAWPARCAVNGNVDGTPMMASDACMACNPEPKPEEPLSLIESMCPFLTTEFIAPGKPYCEDAFEQSPADVTKGAVGEREGEDTLIREKYADVGMCAANVHWHLGAEHYNKGTYDVPGEEWLQRQPEETRRRLAGANTVPGFFCQGYDENDAKMTTEYDWQYCTDTHVGYTYEIHWPHTNAGPCGFMSDGLGGLFCTGLPTMVGVQGQVFVVVNDDLDGDGVSDSDGEYEHPRLIEGMINEDSADIAKYIGSSTGTSHNQEICSPYRVSWHVDRACNMVSAKTLDNMCKVMKEVMGMKKDLYPHGSRELVDPKWVTDKPMTRKLKFGARRLRGSEDN